MKKLIFSLVAAMIASTACFAQSHNLVTVSHEGEVKAFYGDSAFVKAMEVAENGDFVTLSSGRYVGNVTIDKAVKIRGAGMFDDFTDSLNIIRQTFIRNDVTFNIPDSVTQSLTMEGVYINGRNWTTNKLRNAKFKKCYLGGGTINGKNLTYVNCYLMGRIPDVGSSEFRISDKSSITAVNCYIQYFVCDPGSNDLYADETHADLINCYIFGNTNSLRNCVIRNSIIIGQSHFYSSNTYLPSLSTCYNCIAGTSSTMLDYCKGSGNTLIKTTEGIIGDDYHLTDEAAATYLGTDGTQVGMYGGSAPFTAIPNYPRIKKLHLSQPVDGKMTVDIAVSEQK